jgi:uncharacterized membrane protein
MKNDFFTGLVILLPIALTFWLLNFVIHLLTDPFLDLTEAILHHFHLLDKPFLFFSGEEVLMFWSRILILIFLTAFIFLAGFLARILFLNYLFSYGNYLINRIPFINRIYRSVQDGVHALFHREKDAKVKVVLVPFPHHKGTSVGLMPQPQMHKDSEPAYLDKVSIFVPAAPNPTYGLVLIYSKSDVVLFDMTSDEALKFIISCGTIQRATKA